MKKSIQYLCSVVIIMLILIIQPSGRCVFAQKTGGVIKIGVYDSRTVVFAWSRSEDFAKHMQQLRQAADSISNKHDTAMIKENTVQMISFQHSLHQMVFSTGSIGTIMEAVKDKLPGLATTAGVSMIVSKWELNFSDPSIQIVDLTKQVALLFNPKEDIDKMAEEILKNKPVPLDELVIEQDMLDGYCRMFEKK